MRLLRDEHDFCCYAEVPLANGRRADVLGLGPKGEIWIVEIKSSLIDFQVDQKWPEYKDFCDRFYLRQAARARSGHLPGKRGADRGRWAWRGDPPRGAATIRCRAARRKALLLKLARLGADRIHTLMDPTDL